MPCVCRKKITPSQHNPANLKSNTPRSSLTNERKEAAPRDLLLTGVSVASVGSQPRAQPFSQRAGEEKQVFLLPSEGSGALGSPQALGAAVVLSRSASRFSHTSSLCPTRIAAAEPGPAASGGVGVRTGHLCSWPQYTDVHKEFPASIYYPWYHSQQLAG